MPSPAASPRTEPPVSCAAACPRNPASPRLRRAEATFSSPRYQRDAHDQLSIRNNSGESIESGGSRPLGTRAAVCAATVSVARARAGRTVPLEAPPRRAVGPRVRAGARHCENVSHTTMRHRWECDLV